MQVAEDTRGLCMKYTLGTIATDDARHAGVGCGSSFPDDAAQLVAALGLHHHVHILPRRKAGAKGNGQRSHLPGGAQIFLCDDGIHQNSWPCLRQTRTCGVYQNRHGVLCPDGIGIH